MEFKEILKQLVSERGISVKFLAKETKVPVQTLHNWINGTEPRNLMYLKRLSEFFEVTMDYLCFGDVNQSKAPDKIREYEHEINAGLFEVVLRRVKK
jgi:transcriptional regulator with XRE-family HTH domain